MPPCFSKGAAFIPRAKPALETTRSITPTGTGWSHQALCSPIDTLLKSLLLEGKPVNKMARLNHEPGALHPAYPRGKGLTAAVHQLRIGLNTHTANGGSVNSNEHG
jgi:hypothetical protein